MIKKIVCPTDFSQAANNATEYAAKLAQLFGAEVLFINVQRVSPMTAAVSLGESPTAQVRENSRIAVQLLKDLSVEANKMFKISADYEVDITTKSLEKILSEFEGNVLIVMGTNGIDDTYQYLFGTNTYQVVQKANCPVMIIPENVTYGDISKVVFAWKVYNSKFAYPALYDFLDAFHPKFVFLHINKDRTKSAEDVFRILRDVTIFGEKAETDYIEVYSDDVPESINRYMIQSQSDLLVLSYQNKGALERIFRTSIIKDMSATAVYPILVLHG
ncbi:MAG TPA: universal stress protein [Bacteroidia bacterium]|jgi:nucleotide-binding universal stress UspA family protein